MANVVAKVAIAEIFVKLRELPGREQAFVDDRLRRERAEIATRRQKRFRALAEKRELPLEARDSARGVKRRDKELPNFGHRLKSFAAKRVCVGGNAAPAEDAEALGVGGGGDRGFGVRRRCGWEKREAQAEYFWQVDPLFLRAGTEEFVRERGQQARAVAAGAIGVDSAAVGQALEGGKGDVDDFMAGGTAEARDEARATSIVVRVAPIRVPIAAGGHAPLLHICLLSGRGLDVQRRICIYQIGFVGEEILSCGLLKLCNLRKVKIANLHRGDHHFEGFFASGSDSGA